MFFQQLKKGQFLKRFGHAQAGVVLVEFSLALWPLVTALLFVYDIFANFWMLQRVDLAGATIIQLMRDGQVDARQYTPDTFRTTIVCPAVPLVACDRFVVNLSDVLVGPKFSPTQVSQGQWCPGGPLDPRLLQIAFPVPFLSRFWAGAWADSNLHYVSSFAMRNRADAPQGTC